MKKLYSSYKKNGIPNLSFDFVFEKKVWQIYK